MEHSLCITKTTNYAIYISHDRIIVVFNQDDILLNKFTINKLIILIDKYNLNYRYTKSYFTIG
ncbi:hypothetical protein EHRUM4_01620 [Ehrlichia ruminantium]|uniref:Uncharacterized protein n=1 Tax=Ehrlichia ruminantium TaxID=779 RepID=A0A161M650_EHRRU|nr:hypothetical protein EHRUM2_08890 [Ehrlichia ruminantium]GAT79161.1 hypothetical protein EHRUM4_01620 [Ehrlichia ruminantium]